jgi:hypothetical protein
LTNPKVDEQTCNMKIDFTNIKYITIDKTDKYMTIVLKNPIANISGKDGTILKIHIDIEPRYVENKETDFDFKPKKYINLEILKCFNKENTFEFENCKLKDAKIPAM